MRVRVTRPAPDAPDWVAALRRRGFDAVSVPLIAIAPAPDPSSIHAAWQRLAARRAAMFVSGNAVRQFFSAGPPDAAWPAGVRAWATGPGTRAALLQAGVPDAAIDLPPPESLQFDSEHLWHVVAPQIRNGDEVLVVRGADASGEMGRDWLAGQLQTAGARADQVVVYARAMPVWTAAQRQEALAGADAGGWLFSSSQAVRHLQALLPGQTWARARAVATHARIARAARGAGFGVVCESRADLGAIAAALESIR